MNKASGGDGIPAELFQILEDNAVKVLHLTGQKTWKMQKTWKKTEKDLFFIPIPKKSNSKEESNYHTVALISHANKLTLFCFYIFCFIFYIYFVFILTLFCFIIDSFT